MRFTTVSARGSLLLNGHPVAPFQPLASRNLPVAELLLRQLDEVN